MVRKCLPFSVFKRMRRVVTADKVAIRFHYYEGEKEVGQVNYNMQEGHFYVFSWPSSFSALRKAKELLRLLSFAVKIINSEKC